MLQVGENSRVVVVRPRQSRSRPQSVGITRRHGAPRQAHSNSNPPKATLRHGPRALRRAVSSTAAANTAAGADDERPAPGGGSLLDDSRFKSLFTDQDFAIDKDSEEYYRFRPHERFATHPQVRVGWCAWGGARGVVRVGWRARGGAGRVVSVGWCVCGVLGVVILV